MACSGIATAAMAEDSLGKSLTTRMRSAPWLVLTNRFVFPEQIKRKIATGCLGGPNPIIVQFPLPAGEWQRYVGS